MPKQSAGILLYKKVKGQALFLLVHPGGPFFKNKDLGSWTIPKGEFDSDEEALTAAKREFKEETGFDINGDFTQLKPITQKSGKTVYCWAVEGDIDASQIQSNTFEIEWPPKTGKMLTFPEVDRAEWFDYDTAEQKINPAQVGLLEEALQLI
ncbi:NUDIX domain-containing protein [Mucilaginibacter sp. HMF5004]|uniref:NUDIX domain-containing protein n=1 Tax=Mucilaginibacter rivuli TaxID=2857527 RepID=UPI001C5E5B08|nr:NUDIX domain-containing protein [Mucilaginibacter rivuli]MBW4890299.1 NUDIX domain-containing protein [Mucilaginibacter rivuli]